MQKSKRALRRRILLHLFSHLKIKFDLDVTTDERTLGEFSESAVDALLSFRNDHEIEELRSALMRLREGSYGFCISCKSRLSDAHLTHDPAMRLCPACAEALAHGMREAHLVAHP